MTKSEKFNLCQRSTTEEQPRSIILIGLIGIIIYAFAEPGFPEIAKIASSISGLLGFLALYKYGKIVQSHILLRFLWIVIILQLITWFLSVYYTPEWAEKNPKLDYLSRWFVFIPLAWWVAQSKNAIWLLWGSAALGILTSPWTTGYGLQEIIDGFNGKRIDFGLRNAQHTTMFFGIILIGLCCFAKPLLKKSKLLSVPIILLSIYCLFVFIASESRQAWLGLVVSALMLSIYIYHQLTKQYSIKARLLALAGFCTLLTTLIFAALSSERISDRIFQEHNTIKKLEHLDIEKIPYSSIGIRIHSWVNAIDYIKQKPLFGWGSNGQKIAMTKTIWPPHTIGTIDHLHSHYVETLMNFGIVGLLFYFSIWIVIGKMLYREIKAKRIEKEFGYFFSAVCIFWAVICAFESYLGMWTGIFFFNVLMAGIIGRIWYNKLNLPPTT